MSVEQHTGCRMRLILANGIRVVGKVSAVAGNPDVVQVGKATVDVSLVQSYSHTQKCTKRLRARR